MEYGAGFKKNEILMSDTARMKFKVTTLCKISWTQEDQHGVMPLICGPQSGYS